MSCMAPDQPKRYCSKCEAGGVPKQEIIVEGNTILNLDGSRHECLFNHEAYEFEHYEIGNSTIAKWPQNMAIRRRGKNA